MNVKYDAEADAAYVRFSNQPIADTREESDVCIVDVDAMGNLIGIELLSVFGFAGASLYGLTDGGLLTRAVADQILRELRTELLAA